jgi:hypothetical protein
MAAGVLALAALGLLAALPGCPSSGGCTNQERPACSLDGGMGCPTHNSCVDAVQAVDPCAGGASACCFPICQTDKDCPAGDTCVTTLSGSQVCAHGRCVE